MLSEIKAQAEAALAQLLDAARAEPGSLIVVGCSTSEVAGQKIGTLPGPDIAAALLEAFLPLLRRQGLFLAAQCCEHLGRALAVEREALQLHGLQRVNALPRPKAGGSFATAAFAALEQPVLAANLRGARGLPLAAAGLDIGHTLIGMHLREVAVPVRLDTGRIGEAPLVAARTRPPFAGGERAAYDPALL